MISPRIQFYEIADQPWYYVQSAILFTTDIEEQVSRIPLPDGPVMPDSCLEFPNANHAKAFTGANA